MWAIHICHTVTGLERVGLKFGNAKPRLGFINKESELSVSLRFPHLNIEQSGTTLKTWHLKAKYNEFLKLLDMYEYA